METGEFGFIKRLIRLLDVFRTFTLKMSKDYDLPTSLNDEITELALKVTNLRERESGNFDLISDLSS